MDARPDLEVSLSVGEGWREDRTGGTILYFSEERAPLGTRGGDLAATLLTMFVQAMRDEPLAVDPEICRVVDVFGQTVYAAPGDSSRTRREIVPACREIGLLWESL